MKTSEINTANASTKAQSQIFNVWHDNVQSTRRSAISAWFESQAAWFEDSRFAMMTLMITVQSCIGSIACMYIFQNNAADIWFILCTAITMGTNAMFIAQAPAKICLASLYLSILVNSILILMNCF
ncbi:MAG: hypothetical protein JWO09_2110 [Bacteroidetes bacterium]|nr:hypothetical protein [Bacteroidota bacterium]